MFSRKSKAKAEADASSAALKNGPPVPDYLPPQVEAKPAEVTIYVNGKPIRCPPTYTILQACRENGIKIPTLCHHPSLQPTGRCAVCVVHIEGRNPPLQQSCKTHVEQDMIITTNSPEVLYQAQINLREFLGMHALHDLPETSEIEDLVKFVAQGTVVKEEHNSHEYAIVRNQEQCISCTRCVRACSGVQNMNILNIDPDRPLQPISFEGDLPLYATNCIACGQCTAVCPTGAVSARNDVKLVVEQLRKSGPERKILLIQTAPAARLSVGELFGDEPATSPKKTVAALHAMGFDYVFDTTFGADATAQLEAEELVERIKSDGPWPMFTSCCPGWILLVEKKYPHLRKYISRCKSPMMMLATMIRCWMKKQNIPRDRYFSVALMPCTAKKEEILRPDLKDPDGNYDVDVVLTAREMGELIKAMKVDWNSLPGSNKTDYDPPFDKSSGAGALFPVSGGVTESALRVAYGLFTKEVPRDPERCLYEQVRKLPSAAGEWISSEVQVTPDRRHKRPIEAQVINGTRAIQQFLEESHLDTPDGVWTQKGNAFVECMACPGGCIGGGGQPHSLRDDIIARRRAAVHLIDKEASSISATQTMKEFSYEETCGIDSEDSFRELMECDPPMLDESVYGTKRSSKNGSMYNSKHGSQSSSGGSQSARTYSGSSFSANYMGNLTVLYGSQAGFTASFAKHLFSILDHNLPDDVSVHSMDHFTFDNLKDCETVVIMTSTWESDIGLMPQNAVRFWNWLKALPLENLNRLFAKIKFAVCGFGSQKYRYYCGFAVQLQEMFLRLGATPFMDLIKIDVDKPDRGKKAFTRWSKELLSTLQTPVLPDPKYLMVPSITPGGKSAPLSCPRGYSLGTINAVMPYKKIPGADDCFYCEFDTGKLVIEPLPDQYVYIYPSNDRASVEALVNLLYPGMLNTPISVLEAQGKGTSKESLALFPSHLTVRQLFERYLDLTRRPSLWFVQRMETLIEDTQSVLRDVVDDADAFQAWAKDKNYFHLLKMYKDVIPSIEVLITMLPPMLPRCYTPLHQEQARGNTLSFMFKRHAGGLCSNYLANLKKGDKIVFTLGTSEFRRPNDELMQPFYRAMGSAGASGQQAAQTQQVQQKIVSADQFPLHVSTSCLFENLDRKPAVDEVVTEVFDISNPQKEKYRFTIANQETPKYKLSFEPSSGVIKSKYSVKVKAIITVFCTCTLNAKALISCEAIGKKKDDDGMLSLAVPLTIETKLSPKIDFDEIKFVEEIGSGSFGTVSRGEWRGQDVAVKVVKGDRMKSDDFRKECSTLQELRCQYIINFVGFSILPDKCALLTEFMELGSLSKYIHDVLSNEYRSKVALDIAKGMSFLHNCGLMHRDLKPQNILVVSLEPSQQVVVKIADFGVSKELPTSNTALNHTSSTRDMPSKKNLTGGVGTPIYMAPEVLDGQRYTTSADVYSFGVLLLELFSGVEPYDNDKFTSPWQIAQFVTAGNRLEIPKSFPQEIHDLIEKCWSQDPSARPSFEFCVDVLNKYSAFSGASGTPKTSGKKKHNRERSNLTVSVKREDTEGHRHHRSKDKKKKKKEKKEDAPVTPTTPSTPSTPSKPKKFADESTPANEAGDSSSSSSSSVAF